MVSEIFHDACDAMFHVTLNDLKTKVKVIHFSTNRFLIYDFLYAVNTNFFALEPTV